MLNYIAAHITLGKRKYGRKADAKSKWVDAVYETVTKKCFVVQNLVKQFNSIQGNSKDARNSRMTILSALSVGFSHETIVSQCMFDCFVLCVLFKYHPVYVGIPATTTA